MEDELGELLSQWEQQIVKLRDMLNCVSTDFVETSNAMIKYHMLIKNYDDVRKIWSKHANGN